MSESVKLPGNEIERAAANVIEHAGKNIADGATGFGSIVFNGIIGDRVREWRTRNMIRGAAKTAEILENHGVSLEKSRSLPMLEFYSIFEGMSEQDDPDVVNLWAGLLASRMAADDGSSFDKSITQILASLNGTEARVLKFLREYAVLDSETRGAGAAVFLEVPVGKEKEAEEAQATNERLAEERVKKVISLRDEVFRDDKARHYDAAAVTLRNKRLAYTLGDNNWYESFTRRETGNDFRSFEVLDTRKVSGALHRLNREALRIPEWSAEPPDELFNQFQGISVNYGLTTTATYLLECCEGGAPRE